MKILVSLVLLCILGAGTYWVYGQLGAGEDLDRTFFKDTEGGSQRTSNDAPNGPSNAEGNITEASYSKEVQGGPVIAVPEGKRQDWSEAQWARFHMGRYLRDFLAAQDHGDKLFAAQRLSSLSIATLLRDQDRVWPEGKPLKLGGSENLQSLMLEGSRFVFPDAEFPEFGQLAAIVDQAKISPGQTPPPFDGELSQAIIDRALQAAKLGD